MRKIYISVLILFFTEAHLPQNYYYEISFGKFRSASSFHINPSGHIFVTDDVTHEVYKLDTLGSLLKSNGGFGWDDAAFDEPTDVFATDLSVFVADKNNHRIQRFDRDLNFISKLVRRESAYKNEIFGYPMGVTASNQGDLFILDSENNRVLKFDLFGNFVTDMGGFDAGNYVLTKPKRIAISRNNNIFVLDKNDLITFDFFGNGIGKTETGEEFTDIRIIFNYMTINDKKNVWISDLRSPESNLQILNLFGYDELKEIRSSFFFNNRLYVLTRNEIVVYRPIDD